MPVGKKDKMKIWTVEFEDGNYDGRGNLRGIFSTKENAEKFISKWDTRERRNFHIDEVEIDEEL